MWIVHGGLFQSPDLIAAEKAFGRTMCIRLSTSRPCRINVMVHWSCEGEHDHFFSSILQMLQGLSEHPVKIIADFCLCHCYWYFLEMTHGYLWSGWSGERRSLRPGAAWCFVTVLQPTGLFPGGIDRWSFRSGLTPTVCAPLELLDLCLCTCCHARVRPQDALSSSFSQ